MFSRKRGAISVFLGTLFLLVAVTLLLADSGALHQVLQTPPIQLGTSGGNVNNHSKTFCCSGTLGSLVTKNGADYILSNNHVLADSGSGVPGDQISQPGLVDVGCNANSAQIVANLSQAAPLGGGSNVDAAIAQTISGMVDTSGAILDVGVPAHTAAPIDNSAIGRGVAKSGRTTGLTCATIGSINTSVRVQYQLGCGKGKKFTVTYTNQVLVSGNSFSAGGDSGSLIVTSDKAQPIALLFAGSSTTSIGNRISDVTSTLGVSLVGGGTHSVTCPTAAPTPAQGKIAPGEFVRASVAKDQHAARLMADPAILGVGVGASEQDPAQAVVVIYLEQGRAHGPIPAELDGVPTQVVRTDVFRAYGWNEPERTACSIAPARAK